MTHALVVGPERSDVDQLVAALRDEDVLVDRSTDAPSALATFEDLEPDLVLSLDALPEWSGLRLLRHVNRRGGDIPTFLLLDGDEKAAGGNERGARDGEGGGNEGEGNGGGGHENEGSAGGGNEREGNAGDGRDGEETTGTRNDRASRSARAQMAGITTVDLEAMGPRHVVELVLDAAFEEAVDTHRDRRRLLAIATAQILRDAMSTLSRATNYRDSSELLKDRVIATTREVIWDALCSNLVDIPGYAVVWVARFDAEAARLVPQEAAGMDPDGLRQRDIEEYVRDAEGDLRAGEVVIREDHDHTEAIIPLPAAEDIHGTVHVYRRGRGFPSVERDRLVDLGRTVGTFLSALERIREVSEDEPGPEGAAEPGGAVEPEEEAPTEEVPEEAPEEEAAEEKVPEEEAAEEPEEPGEEGVEPEEGGPPAAEEREGDGPESAAPAPAETGLSPLEAYSETIAHELRNHVNVAQAFLDLGMDQGDGDNFARVDEALDRIERVTDEAAAVAGGPVDPAQMASGSLQTDAHLAWERVEAEPAQLTVETDLSFRADHDQIGLLLENLFRNAVEHVGQDVSIRVGPLSGDREGFYVEDDGPGIPEADRERLFEWGESGGDSEGGIGLAIVHRIATNHGWAVSITDGEMGGARFELEGVDVLE
ncbi:MAG: ATP-binding protein [Halodesulfurarchaeum sp.]